MPLTILCVNDDKGATKTLRFWLAEIVYAFIHFSKTFWHMTDAILSFEVQRSL